MGDWADDCMAGVEDLDGFGGLTIGSEADYEAEIEDRYPEWSGRLSTRVVGTALIFKPRYVFHIKERTA